MSLWKSFAIVLLLSASITSAATERARDGRSSLAQREHEIWSSAFHGSQFSTMHGTTAAECGDFKVPDPVATPDPPLDGLDNNSVLSVSFIVGTDGQVISPLIMDSAGRTQDRFVLTAVKFWRYRPALCDGEPVNTEATVRFYRR